MFEDCIKRMDGWKRNGGDDDDSDDEFSYPFLEVTDLIN